MSSDNKKLLYSGLIHSHLVYGLPIWGFAAKGRLEPLKIKQKKAIRKIYNLKYREHTNQYFIQSEILKISELIEHTTMCYMQASMWDHSPRHIKCLWEKEEKARVDLRDKPPRIRHAIDSRQFIQPTTHRPSKTLEFIKTTDVPRTGRV